jgi:hypothetical protein
MPSALKSPMARPLGIASGRVSDHRLEGAIAFAEQDRDGIRESVNERQIGLAV